MKINKKYLGLTALLSATAAASVFAAGATGTTSSAVMNKAFGSHGNHTQTESQRKEHQVVMATSLAKALGTTVDAITSQLNAGKSPRDIIKASGLDEATVKAQLEASREADMKARLVADVASGKITQAQANEILANKGNHKGGKGRSNGKGGEMMLIHAASVLGTTKEALQAQMSAGKTLQDVVALSGMTEASFHTKMQALRQSEMKTKLQADITAGKLTQAQADQKLSDMLNHKGGRGQGGERNKTADMAR